MNINYWKSRSLIIFLLTFASLADLAAPLTIGEGFLGIIKTFFIIGVVFILQDKFKRIRLILLMILSTAYMLWLIGTITNDWTNIEYYLTNKIIAPAAMPLYFSIMLFGILSYMFLRSYDMTK